MTSAQDRRGDSGEFGEPAQFYSVVSGADQQVLTPGTGAAWHVGSSADSEGFDVRVLVRYGTVDIDDLWFVRIDSAGQEVQTLFHLAGEHAVRLVEVFRSSALDPTSRESRPHGQIEAVPGLAALAAAYGHQPEAMRALIAGDATADDVIAVAHRKAVVLQFRRMLEDPGCFDELVAEGGRGPEAIWQKFFEKHPWLLGLGLSEHLFVGWNPERLEQTVSGHAVSGPGKRADALLRTAGVVRLLAFAEIKHHRTFLLSGKQPYRSGCWAPHEEVVGAVAQSQGTVELAQREIGMVLKKEDEDGYRVFSDDAYLYRPRSFVVVGSLGEFVNEQGQRNEAKVRSFELYRRNVTDPVILTFDEVLARAEAAVASIESNSNDGRPTRENTSEHAAPAPGE